MNKANEIAKQLGLRETSSSYSYYWQNKISNDELITELQEQSVRVCGEGEAELFVFSDSSCINRQGDEYFINDDVDLLDTDYLNQVGY